MSAEDKKNISKVITALGKLGRNVPTTSLQLLYEQLLKQHSSTMLH
jgi:hypothetical protein